MPAPGLTAEQIDEHDWVRGPRWLEHDPGTWPLKPIDYVEEVTTTDEGVEIVVSTALVSNDKNQTRHEKLVDLSRFSKLDKALRVTALVGKIAKKWAMSTKEKRASTIRLETIQKLDASEEITSIDMKWAEQFLICQEQNHLKLEELQRRFHDKKIICDTNGILRHESRLQNAYMPFDTKSPIFIPKESDLVRLILVKIHEDNAHCGKEHTLSTLRQRFWVPRISSSFKKYLKNCTTCKRYQGLPLGAPNMPPLPLDRVIVAKPFKNTGCDFMGPFTSKTQDKMYVCLYTCLTTRAVHLEVVENLSTAAFLTSFIRFISRRGVSNTMRSDCGTNFKNGEQIIDAMFRKDDDSGASVMTYCAKERIKWIFNPPASSWMGGVWERLVGSVKKALNKSIGRRKLTFADMCTVITRIEAIFNTRPLTKCDPEDLTKIPLRPVDFLQGNVKFSIPDTHVDERDPQFDPSFIRTEKQALEALRFSEKIADKFWETWKIQYLVSLREMEKINYKQPRHSSRSIPELGEIVLIEQDLIPRGNWPYGKVVELISSADELVRSAKILMPNHRIIQRPLNKIFPLEIRSVPEDQKASDVVAIDKDRASTTSRGQLPSRAAKTRAYDVIRDFEESLESHPQISCSARTSLSMIMVFCLISPSICGNVSSSIQCSSGKVKIIPPGGPFQLCFNSDCHIPAITERNLSFSLPISPRNDKVHVHLRSLLSNKSEQFKMCDRPLFCDHQYFLSKSILGNPHCWPAGAIATIAALTYLAIMALVSMLCAVSKLRKRISTPGVLSRRKRSQPIQTSAVNFELMPLASALAICAIICSLSSSALACQHGYMRHTADLICKDRARCYLEYNRELFFNKLQSELCVEIFHDEKPIGTARFTKKPVEFKCSKVIEPFTRMTTTSAYHSKRCAQAGSCTDDICERVKANDTIPELSKAMRYPGYSGCFSSCGGFLCGCFMPQPACSFYRVAHEPVSEDIFEVLSRCSHWSPTVSTNFELEIEGNRTSWSESLVPYVSKEIDGFNLTIISIQKPANSMANKRFAISNNGSFILQDDFRL